MLMNVTSLNQWPTELSFDIADYTKVRSLYTAVLIFSKMFTIDTVYSCPGSLFNILEMSYFQILQSLQPTGMGVKILKLLWNLAGSLAAILLWCQPNFKVIGKS